MVRGIGHAAALALVCACTGHQREPGSSREPLEGDPFQPNCGFEVVDPPDSASIDPCLGGPAVATLAGPLTLPRTAGPPDEVDTSFTVAAAGRFCVRVVHAGVSTAWLSIDGQDLLGPGDFDPHLTLVTARPALEPGSHVLHIRIASRPGASLTVEVRQAPPVDPVDTRVGPEEHVAISGLSDEPDPFSPAGTSGLATETTIGVTATALATPGSPSSRFDFLLRADFEIAGASRCLPVQTLTVETDASAGAGRRLAAAWNGRDGAGVLVQEGTYFYRATVSLVRRHRSIGDRETLDTVASAIQAITAVDPHGVRDMTTRELTTQVREIKSHGESYHDLSAIDRACYDASMAARAARRTQKQARQRFFPVSDLYPGDNP